MDERTDYQKGFDDGWEAAKAAIEKQLLSACEPFNQFTPKKYDFPLGCEVCGICSNGEPLGHVCAHPQCPTRLMNKRSTSTQQSSPEANIYPAPKAKIRDNP